MSNYVKLLNNLDKLKLVKIKENLDIYIELINQNKKDIVESLYELTDKELEFKDSKAIIALVRMAGFPYQKTFEDFDFTFQPAHLRTEERIFRHGVGRGALAPGIGKDMDAGQGDVPDEVQRLGKFRLCLAGKANNEVRREHHIWHGLAVAPDDVKVELSGVFSVHLLQYRVAP